MLLDGNINLHVIFFSFSFSEFSRSLIEKLFFKDFFLHQDHFYQ